MCTVPCRGDAVPYIVHTCESCLISSDRSDIHSEPLSSEGINQYIMQGDDIYIRKFAGGRLDSLQIGIDKHAMGKNSPKQLRGLQIGTRAIRSPHSRFIHIGPIQESITQVGFAQIRST